MPYGLGFLLLLLAVVVSSTTPQAPLGAQVLAWFVVIAFVWRDVAFFLGLRKKHSDIGIEETDEEEEAEETEEENREGSEEHQEDKDEETLPKVQEVKRTASPIGDQSPTNRGRGVEVSETIRQSSMLPWPYPLSPKLLEFVSAQYNHHPTIPLGVTLWMKDGSLEPNGNKVIVVHELAPGTACALGVFGSSDSGKSRAIVTGLAGAATIYSPKDWEFQIVDLSSKGGRDFVSLQQLPHARSAINDATQLRAGLREINQEVRRRLSLFDQLRGKTGTPVSNIADYNYKAVENSMEKLPMFVLVVEELKSFNEVMQNGSENIGVVFIDKMAREYRYLGIVPIVATQYPIASVIPRTTITQIAYRLVFKLIDPTQTNVVFGSSGAIAPHLLPEIDPRTKRNAGRAIYQAGSSSSQRLIQCTYLSPEDLELLCKNTAKKWATVV